MILDLHLQDLSVALSNADWTYCRQICFLAGKFSQSGCAPITPPHQEQRQQAAEAAAMKKDPDAYRAKMEAMESARLRMQEQYNQVFHRLKTNSKLN